MTLERKNPRVDDWAVAKTTTNKRCRLMPILDQQSIKLLNLTVLKRMDPSIEDILVTATHVTFYELDTDLMQWSRKEVEGSLFVVRRKTQPRFQFVVLNRRNIENLVENITRDFEYEVQVPYLLFRNSSQEVNAVWFYSAPECEEVANLFSRCKDGFLAGARSSAKTRWFTAPATI